MPRVSLLRSALCDLCDDIAHHGMSLAHGAFDLTCVLALGLLVYATGIDSADAGQDARPLFGVQARIDATPGAAVNSSHAPTSCGLTNDLLASPHRDCITAMVLDQVDA